MNVDKEEVAKFEAMAQEWWNAEGPCKLLHQMNPLRLQYIQRYADLSESRVLDLGCGGGILTEALADRSPEVWGLDQSSQALEVARRHSLTQTQPPHYVLDTAENFAQHHPESFDIITCLEMLEHVPEPVAILQACSVILKPGGKLFLSTLHRTLHSFLQAIVGAEYVLRLLPRGTHDYARFIRPSELASWAAPYGLQVKALQGLRYHPFSGCFSLSQDVSVNYLMYLEKSP